MGYVTVSLYLLEEIKNNIGRKCEESEQEKNQGTNCFGALQVAWPRVLVKVVDRAW